MNASSNCRFISTIVIMIGAKIVFCDTEFSKSNLHHSPHIVVHSPKNGEIVPIELHGWDSLMIDVNLTITNFYAPEGSLALFIGNGELLLSEQWQPLNGNRVIRYELPFPDKDDHRERLEFLTKGHHISFRLEFSLLDSGNFEWV